MPDIEKARRAGSPWEAATPTLFDLDETLQPHLIPVEVNLEGFPLFSRQKTPEGTAIEVRQTVSTEDGRRINQLWRVTANVDFSLPGTYDEDVFVGVMALVKQRGGMPKDGLIRFSVYELMKVLGKAKNGENNRKIKESLNRIASTMYYSENAFYEAESESLETHRFALWDVHWSRARGRDGRSAEHHTLGFNKVIVRSYNAGYLKLLDTDLYFALKLPLAKALYRLVDQRRGEAKSWTVNARELRDLLAMSKRYGAASRIFEVLGKAHRVLRREKFLESASLKGETIRYKIHPEFARDWFPEQESSASLEDQAIEALKSAGVRPPARARKLVEDHGPQKAFHVLEVLRSRGDLRNPGGWASRVLEEGDPQELAETAEFLIEQRAAEAEAENQPRLGEADGEVERAQSERRAPEVPDPEAEALWALVLEDLGGEIDETTLSVWFGALFGAGTQNRCLRIVAPNELARGYVQSRFGEALGRAVRDRGGEGWRYEVVAAEGS